MNEKHKVSKSLGPLKEKLKEHQKEKMRTGKFYYCDGCNRSIYRPEDGYIIHGNIYMADPSCRGFLIGNNFPEVKPGDKIEVTDVKEVVYCFDCLKRTLGVKQYPKKLCREENEPSYPVAPESYQDGDENTMETTEENVALTPSQYGMSRRRDLIRGPISESLDRQSQIYAEPPLSILEQNIRRREDNTQLQILQGQANLQGGGL